MYIIISFSIYNSEVAKSDALFILYCTHVYVLHAQFKDKYKSKTQRKRKEGKSGQAPSFHFFTRAKKTASR